MLECAFFGCLSYLLGVCGIWCGVKAMTNAEVQFTRKKTLRGRAARLAGLACVILSAAYLVFVAWVFSKFDR